MPSNHTGDPATFNATISFPTDGDPKKITPIRSSLDLLLDNDAYLKARRADTDLREAALRFSVLDLLGSTLDDTSDFMAATQLLNSPVLGVLAVKSGTNDTYYVWPDDVRGRLQGDVASVTSDIREAANNGSRIVVIGTGGNLNSYSDNEGAAWSAGGTGIGGAVEHLVWSPSNALSGGGAKFFSGGSGTGSVYTSPNGSTAWTAVASSFAAVKGLAVLGGSTANNGYVVALGNSGAEPRMSVLTDGGAGGNFTGPQTPPFAALADEPGSIAGAPSVSGAGDYVYHVARSGSGARLRLAMSSDGSTWVSGPTPTIERPTTAGAVFSGAPRLMIDQNTGLMVIAVPLAVPSAAIAVYASRDFETWVGPAVVNAADVGAFAVAGGRVWFTQDDRIMVSAGLGAGVLA